MVSWKIAFANENDVANFGVSAGDIPLLSLVLEGEVFSLPSDPKLVRHVLDSSPPLS